MHEYLGYLGTVPVSSALKVQGWYGITCCCTTRKPLNSFPNMMHSRLNYTWEVVTAISDVSWRLQPRVAPSFEPQQQLGTTACITERHAAVRASMLWKCWVVSTRASRRNSLHALRDQMRNKSHRQGFHATHTAELTSETREIEREREK